MTPPAVHAHPLSALLSVQNLRAAAYLQRVAERHRALGYGSMATRKEKITRWTRGITPERTAQLAMADLHGIDPREIERLGWPAFLNLALADDRRILDSPWVAAGTVEALTDAADAGGPVDRRGFLIVSSTALAATTAQWAAAAPAEATTGRARRVGADTADLFDARLDALRHLDDAVGARQAYDAAVLELRLITDVVKNASFSAATGRRLFACAAEAARLAGWCAYDGGRHAAAERHFVTSLRASASAENAALGALTLSFWANLRYSNNDPSGALDLLDAALARRSRIPSARVVTLLHARRARAHSKSGDAAKAFHAVDAAFNAYALAGPPGEDLPATYWVTHGELHQVAGSTALSVDEPRRALRHFAAALTHADPYDEGREVRGTAIYLSRQAEAHLALGDVDAALDVGRSVFSAMGGVDSARSTSTLDDLRGRLGRHRELPSVRDFLEQTA